MNEIDGWTTLIQGLVYLVYGGAVFIAGQIYSQLLETIPGWDKVPSWAKRYIVLAIALILAITASVLINLPQETIEAIKPYLLAIGFTLLGWWNSQKEYNRIKTEERMQMLEGFSK